jgi:hypothetical protein
LETGGPALFADLSCKLIGVPMTPALATFFVSAEFNDFLYAPIGAEDSTMTLSVLSALSRLNVDPWAEAAQLSALPKDIAAQRLASLIARLPGGRWAQADCAPIAKRLILPQGLAKVRSAPLALHLPLITHSTGLRILACAALALTVLLVAARNEPSSRNGHVDQPAFNTQSPTQVQ